MSAEVGEMYFTIKDVVRMTQQSVKTIRNAIKAGKLKGSQPGGRNGKWLFTKADIDAYIDGGRA